MEKIVIVDDDELCLKAARKILSSAGLDAVCLGSGEKLLEYIQNDTADLILLDVHMSGIDGFETMRKMGAKHPPVIFLTADDDAKTESRGLSTGAMDFIKKPFAADILLLRVRHTIDLVRLQAGLETEVERMSSQILREHEKNERLSMQVVATLAGAIDAKDKYTNGHSVRVAEYSREIARRAGMGEKRSEDIYMIGLLHDVGKIGVPDTVINKPFRLTDEEYAIIKTHPVIGYNILKSIKELPQLAIGARWHHERYDGRGYPDGLSGEDIPEEARIIAVADAYDAMSSRRSYHEVFSQDYIKSEMRKGKGTQFDPVFADIMTQMIEEDTHYEMRVHELPAENSAEVKDDSEVYEVLEKNGINTEAGMMYCMNDKDFYFEILLDFAAASEGKIYTLEKSLEARDWENYRICAHVLKSSSATIGAERFSEQAKVLENAAKQSDEEYITSHHAEFTQNYLNLINTIKQGVKR